METQCSKLWSVINEKRNWKIDNKKKIASRMLEKDLNQIKRILSRNKTILDWPGRKYLKWELQIKTEKRHENSLESCKLSKSTQ